MNRLQTIDADTLVPDEDTAPVVKRIFPLCAAGNGPKRVATILTKEQVVNPSNAYYCKIGKGHRGLGHHQTLPAVFQHRHQHSEQ